ncbi:MAG: radical SAM family heme chaperone HemW [Bacteroidales bacterium]|jgi:oxygen-independent coproporphyrinogen-3 oxidase|nr:radical SAM family heme chaperone HemW [Bacteroidales bacterium]
MQGLYIHIPFCESKCYYCGFYSTADRSSRKHYLQAVLNEARERARKQERIQKPVSAQTPEQIDTLYIGGGTPSVFSAEEIAEFLKDLSGIYNLSHLKEATLEVNPEHIAKSDDYLKILLERTPVRRISMGVQSFDNDDLKFLGRRHNALIAIRAIEKILKANIELSIDLIYGIPTSTNKIWKNNLQFLKHFGLNHFSAYSLTIEPNTVFAKKQIELNEDTTLQQYDILQQWCAENGYEQYETSNYARQENYALHNCNYWNLSPYTGLGVSAHSYSGFNKDRTDTGNTVSAHSYQTQPCATRRWNINNFEQYISDPANSYQQEHLTEADTFHEYIMTALRTKWGVQKQLLQKFSPQLKAHFNKITAPLLQDKTIVETKQAYILKSQSKLFADMIAEKFF